MSNNINFNLTIPIAKSDRTDGWYITGIAAGTEVDRENDSLTLEAIERLAKQVNTGMVPFRNHHRKDSITEDMGYLTKAEVNDNRQLRVEAKLDEDNPDAQYLWRKLDKGKQFGMSIEGSSVGWYSDIDKTSGKRVRKHPFVIMDECSATTRPVYTPSLGTVLRKAIDEADASLATGDTSEMTTPTQSGETLTQTTESSAPENDTLSKGEALSPSQELVKSLMENGDFVTLIKSAVAEATSASTEPEDSVDDSTEISKSEPATATDVAEMVKSAVIELSKAFKTQIEELEGRIPATGVPLLTKSVQETDDEILTGLRADPRTALRVGLAARHGELDKL